ncbi:MAG: S41 family peptidase [Thermodesulfobacteriota bacterium]
MRQIVGKIMTFSGISITAVLIMIIIGGVFQHTGASSDDTYQGLKIFSDVIELIEANYVDPVDSKTLIRKAIQGMLHSLDPHSMYLPPEQFESLQDDAKGEFSGVGIVITLHKEMLTVVSPIEGTPAHKAGVKPKDIIIKIDGKSTRDMSISEAVQKIKGTRGTSVTITIMRKGVTKPIDFVLMRNIIPIESVRSIELKPEYGYVRLYNFTEKSEEDLKASLNKLESGKNPLKGLIIDLRDNPGGLLPQAVAIADLFIDKGVILSIRGRISKHNDVYNATPNKKRREYPIVVLINGGSASASEIVAGALQDHNRAIILGTTSFGKGSVQTVKPLRDGSGIKFTVARYYTPNDRSIQAKGIEPDITLKRRIRSKETTKEIEDLPIKEKDLQNHLEAEPERKKGEEDKANKDKKDESDRSDLPDSSEKKELMEDSELDDTEYSELKPEKLLADNQVQYALDLLISHGVFKKLKY